MTAKELQAIRDKHFSDFCDCPDKHPPFECVGCARMGAKVVWPCEVIQVLDAFENPDISCDTEQAEIRNDCDHRYIDNFGVTMDFRMHFTGYRETLKRYAFCPLCGERI